jgi:MFS family permease
MTPQTTGVPSQRVPTESGTPPTGANRTDDLSTASTGELVQRLSAQLSELVRRELDLARTELATKGKRAGAGAGLAGAGGVVALFGVGALIASAIAGLATVVPVWLSALIVGVVLLLVAGVLALIGRGRLREATPPVPEQAVRGVQNDVAAVKNAVHR